MEIATYTAFERLASSVGDTRTAWLAASIRKDEEQMLERIERELPKLRDAVVRASPRPRATRRAPWPAGTTSPSPGTTRSPPTRSPTVCPAHPDRSGDNGRAGQVRAYERDHKNRAGVMRSAEHERSNAEVSHAALAGRLAMRTSALAA